MTEVVDGKRIELIHLGPPRGSYSKPGAGSNDASEDSTRQIDTSDSDKDDDSEPMEERAPRQPWDRGRQFPIFDKAISNRINNLLEDIERRARQNSKATGWFEEEDELVELLREHGVGYAQISEVIIHTHRSKWLTATLIVPTDVCEPSLVGGMRNALFNIEEAPRGGC